MVRRRRSRAGCGVVLLAAATTAWSRLPAQEITSAAADTTRSVLAGFVTDTAGTPLAFASLAIAGVTDWVMTAPDGSFRLTGIAPGWQEVAVRRLGYRPLLFEVQFPANVTVHVVLRLTPLALELPAIVVEGRPEYASLVRDGFYRRRRAGGGTYFGPEDLAHRSLPAATSLLRMVAGVRVVPRRTGGGIPSIFDNVVLGRAARGDCVMPIRVNRYLLPAGLSVDEFVRLQDILAVEVYPRAAAVPAELVVPGSNCGVVAIWTR
jgi:hypothetical protein